MVQQEGPAVLFRGLKPAFAFQIAVNGTRLGESNGVLVVWADPHSRRRRASRRARGIVLCPSPRCMPTTPRARPRPCPSLFPGTFLPLKKWLVAHRDAHGLDEFFTSLVAGAGGREAAGPRCWGAVG